MFPKQSRRRDATESVVQFAASAIERTELDSTAARIGITPGELAKRRALGPLWLTDADGNTQETPILDSLATLCAIATTRSNGVVTEIVVSPEAWAAICTELGCSGVPRRTVDWYSPAGQIRIRAI